MKNLLKQRKFLFTAMLMLLLGSIQAQDPSAILELESNEQGFLMPRMTTAERIAIPSPAQGLQVFDTDFEKIFFYSDTWRIVGQTLSTFTKTRNINTGFPPDFTDVITITEGEGFINENSIIKVCVDITHAWNSDIDLTLTAPDGTTTLELSTDNGSSGDNYTGTCFTTDATTSITSGVSPFYGDYLPEGDFSILVGQSINGDWALNVSDDVASSDDGVLQSWSISLPGNDIEELGDNIPLAYNTDWLDYNVGFTQGTFCVKDGRVFLDGLVRKINSDIATNDVICTLPFGFRPKKKTIFTSHQNGAPVRIDILPNGDIVLIYVSPDLNGDWINLSGINFSLE